MTGVLLKGGDSDPDTQKGRCPVKTKTEIRVTHLEAKEHLRERGLDRLSLTALRRNQAGHTFIWDL